jgi:accessory gene regulator B
MLDQIIKNCLDQMQEKNLIMEDNREYYQYAMELLVEESLTVGTILVVIICMQEFVNGVIFLISFLALRRRTGGFHMKTFKACYVATIGTFIGVLLVKNIMYTK